MINRSCAFSILKGCSAMKEDQLIELLDRHIDTFINNIAIELEETHDKWFDSFGFPMLGETSKQHHEQVYFQSYLESYTRQMINGILKEVVDKETAADITWPEFDYSGIYRGYTNAEYEREFGFEFIDHDNNTGYRYSFFHCDEIDGLLAKGNVDATTLVIWENEDEIVGFEYEDKRAKVILLWDLFLELFSGMDEQEIKNMYDLFISRVTKAVEIAKSMISLTTLPGFTPSYLYKSRDKTVADLKKEVGSLSCFTVNNANFKQNEFNSRQLIETYGLAETFLNNRFENVFVGTSDFAKSYLTSEYLFRYFEDNPMFDYTPIVSGYLKSIEQLLHAICASYFKCKNIQKDFSGYTLNTYITDIKRERVFKRELLPVKNIIISCLNSYRSESRNNLFHKDYFNSWKKVEQIRTNTIFLYVALLGSVESYIIMNDPTVLGILNIEYDQMFSVIDKQKDGFFSLVVGGKEYSEMRKEPRDRGLMFDKNGLITNTILFKKYDYDHEESVEVSRFNMPSTIWITDSSENKISQLWPTTTK